MELTRRSRRAPAGFTLVELLAATALFALLGTLLFQMMQGAMDVWSRGQRVRDAEERAGAALDLLAEDLRHVFAGVSGAGEQDARFLCEVVEVDFDGDGLVDGRTTRLRFTRLLHEARSLPWLARAGERPAAEGVATLTGQEDPASLQPTGGLAESLFTSAVLPGEILPSLIRKVRSPGGGPDSLVADELREEQLLAHALRLVDRVLFFGVQCWTPQTVAWDVPPGVDGGAVRAWDSTRGGLVPESDFPLERGAASRFEAWDDTWPTILRITLVLDPYQGGEAAPGVLAEELPAQATRLFLRAPLQGDEREPSHVWVGGEWMAVRSVAGRQLEVLREGPPRAHAAGTQVRTGRIFRRDVALPAARENLDP